MSYHRATYDRLDAPRRMPDTLPPPEKRPEFSSINEFDPAPLEAREGARICEALNRAIDMIEVRKDTY